MIFILIFEENCLTYDYDSRFYRFRSHSGKIIKLAATTRSSLSFPSRFSFFFSRAVNCENTTKPATSFSFHDPQKNNILDKRGHAAVSERGVGGAVQVYVENQGEVSQQYVHTQG